MKKSYSKPEIVFESFSLSTNIAGDCAVKTNTPSQNQCPYQGDFDYPIFITREMGCITTDPDGDGELNGFCYHVPTVGTNLFNS